MVQIARPASDISLGFWSPNAGTTAYTQLRETIADDLTTYVFQNFIFFSDTFEVKLSALTDPVSSTGHILRIRTRDDSSIGSLINVALYQGTTSIATFNTGDGFGGWLSVSYTLSAGEANAITDYTDLRVRVTGQDIVGTNNVDVTWIEFEVPDAPGGGTPGTWGMNIGGSPIVEDQTFAAPAAAWVYHDWLSPLGFQRPPDGGAAAIILHLRTLMGLGL